MRAVPSRMLPSTVPQNRNGSCKHDAEAAAQVVEVHVFDIDAVDADGALLHVVEAHQERDQGGLARAGVADDGDGLAGFEREADVAQDPVGCGGHFVRRLCRLCSAGRAGTPSLHERCRRTRHGRIHSSRPCGLLRYRGRGDFYFRIEQLEHALARCHGRLQDVVLFAEVLNRAEKSLRVLHERDQHAERHPSARCQDRLDPMACSAPEPDN